MFYTSLEAMRSRFDREARKDRMELSSKEAFLAWQVKARETLRSLLALDRLEKVSPDPEETECVTVNGIRRKRVVIRTERGVAMPFYILSPEKSGHEGTVYITPPGHLGGGKDALAGIRDRAEISSQIDFYGYDYALMLAEKGYTAAAFDPRGFGERRERAEQDDGKILSSSCKQLAHMAEGLGLTLAGLLVFDIMCLTDYLMDVMGYSDVRILGFSGGGLQALYASALDERIGVTFISGYFYGFKEALLEMAENCSCNYIPSLWVHFDVQDIAAMIAPRPLVIQSARDDHLAGRRGLANVIAPMDELRLAYELSGAGERLYHHIVQGGHHFEKDGALEAIERVTSQGWHPPCRNG